MAQGAYENPQLTAVDYSVVDKNIAQGVQALSQSMVSIAQQRKEAYQRVQEEFAKFKDLSYIQQAKGLDAQTMDAIRQSTNNVTSLADFSNRTEYEKSQILNSVKDTKAAMASIEEMIKLKNSGAVLDKRANKEYYDLLANLSSMKGVRVKPAEDRVGFTLISDTFDKDGNKVGEEEFTESDLIAMPSMFQDVSPVLEGVDAQIKEMAASSQKGWENAVANGQDFTRDNIRDKISSYVDEMEEEEKSVYFSQRIFEFGEFAPPMDGSISKEERDRIKSLNNETIKEYITDRVWERLNKPVDPEIEMQRRARYSRDKSSGKPKDYEVESVKEFKKNVVKFQTSKNPAFIEQYTNRSGIGVEVEGDEVIFFRKKEITGEESVTDPRTGKTTSFPTQKTEKSIITRGNIRDAELIYNAIRTNSQEIPYFKFLDLPETMLSPDEVRNSMLEEGVDRDYQSEADKKLNPRNWNSGVYMRKFN